MYVTATVNYLPVSEIQYAILGQRYLSGGIPKKIKVRNDESAYREPSKDRSWKFRLRNYKVQ
jgi:hypothetical protein